MALQARLNSEFDARAGVPGAIFIPDYAIHAAITSENARLDAVETHKEQISGSGAGRITLGTTVGHETRATRQKDAQEKRQREQTDMIRFLNLIDDFQEQINANNRQIAENETLIKELLADRVVLQELAHRLESDEYLEMNEDGTFADPEIERIIAYYEDEYGIIVDRTDPAAIRELIEYNRQEELSLRQENLSLERENEVLRAEGEQIVQMSDYTLEDIIEMGLRPDLSEQEERVLEFLTSNLNADEKQRYNAAVHEENENAQQLLADGINGVAVSVGTNLTFGS